MPQKATKHKDAPKNSKHVARDPKTGKLGLVRSTARSATMPSKPKEQGDLRERLKSVLDYTGGRTKGYDNNKGRATRRDRTHTMTQENEVEEAADDGDVAGREAAGNEDTDEEDDAEVQTSRGSPAEGEPAEVGADGGSDGGEYAGLRVEVFEDVSEADAAGRMAARRDHAMAAGAEAPRSTELVRRGLDRARQYDPRPDADGVYSAVVEAARRNDARMPAAGVVVPPRDLDSRDLVRSDRARPYDARGYAGDRHLGSREPVTRDPDRARRHNVRGDADRREVPTTESNRRDSHRREPVRPDYAFEDDYSPAIERPGVERIETDRSILERMPPLEVGDDNFVANRKKELDPESIRWERQQRLAPQGGWEVAKHWSAAERAAWQKLSIEQRAAWQMRHSGGQRHGGQHHGGQGYHGQGDQGQGYQGQGYHGQGYQGQGYHGQVGQGRGAQ